MNDSINKSNKSPNGTEPPPCKQDLRLALEEANRWHRYIDNFFWVLSSFIIIGTGFAISKALEWGGKDYRILILAVIMIVMWYWFLQFLKDTLEKIQFYLDIINYYEQELSINVLPNEMSDIEKRKISPYNSSVSSDISNNNKPTLSTKTFPFAKQLKSVKAKYFSWIMLYIIYLSWIIWLFFIVEYVFLEVSETFGIIIAPIVIIAYILFNLYKILS